MTTHMRHTSPHLARLALPLVLAILLPVGQSRAQNAPASNSAGGQTVDESARIILNVPDFPEEFVWGRTVRIHRRDGLEYEGELVAVGEDFLLMQYGDEVVTYPFNELQKVEVERHDFGWGKVAAWTTLGALVTGAGMSWACNQVSGAECGGVFLGVAIPWALVGGLSGLSITSSRYESIPLHQGPLSPFARYPQGWTPN